MDTKIPVASTSPYLIRYMPSPFYQASVVFFQLHGGMVSSMQVLPIPFSSMHIT